MFLVSEQQFYGVFFCFVCTVLSTSISDICGHKTMNNSINHNCTPCKNGLSIPSGFIVIHPRWITSDLAKLLKLKLKITFMDEIGAFDFLPSSNCCIIYITESDIISSLNNCKKKIAKLNNSLDFSEKYVLVDHTSITKEHFFAIQKFVVLECNMCIFPMESSSQVVELLEQSVRNIKPNNHNFAAARHNFACTDSGILATIQTLPEIGNSKAKLLLETFGSVEAIVYATEYDLAKVVGKSAAHNLHSLF